MDDKKLNFTENSNRSNLNVDISEIFWRYFNHWRWILLSVLVSLVIGYFYAKMQIDVYQINASVLIKSPDKYGQSKLLKDIIVESGGDVENEVEVFRSKRLLIGVVDSLGLNVSYYYQTILNKPSELYTASPIKINYDNGILKQLPQPIIFTIKENDEELNLEYSFRGVVKSQSIHSFPFSISTPIGKFQLITKFPKVSLVRPLIIVIQNTNVIISGLAVQAEMNKKNEIISLSTKTYNPQKGVDVLNKVIECYNRDAMMQSNQSAVNTANFIEERLHLLTSELAEVEMKVENYKKSHKFTDISSEANIVVSRNSKSEDLRSETELQLKLLDYVESFIINEKNSFHPIPNVGLNDNVSTNIMLKYNDAIAVRSHLLDLSSSDNPVLETNSKLIVNLRKSLISALKNVKKVLNIKLNDITNTQSKAESKISDIPRQERELVEITRQQKIKEQLYIFLLQKREESALSMALTVPKAVVINEASVGGLVSINKSTILMYAFIFGFFFPLGIIYLINLFNTKVLTRRDLEHATDLPIISEMAHSESTEEFAVSETGLDPTTELFRLLRTKLNFVLDHPSEKVVLVTSSEPGEGKTFISVNLALGLAMTDKKVLLLGLDLRKPQLADKFKIDRKEGITSYLSHQEQDIESLIYHSEEYANLSVLHSGIIPPNPNELLMRNELSNLISYFRDKYDYIVIDSAPVGVVSDTLLLLKHTDIVLYVCRAKITSKKSLDVVNRLSEDEPELKLYLILNDVTLRKKYYKYRGRYGYSYGYGYGYGYGYKKKKKSSENDA